MTYANAVLTHAMFDASERWPDEDFLPIAETSFGFLNLATLTNKMFWSVGNENWYPRGEEKSAFDQQPVEASTMAAAAMAGLRSTGHESYRSVAIRAKRWFSGHNSSMQSLVDVERGACCDGIQPSGLNLNQGAESTLAYLWTEMLERTNELAFDNRNESLVSLV